MRMVSVYCLIKGGRVLQQQARKQYDDAFLLYNIYCTNKCFRVAATQARLRYARLAAVLSSKRLLSITDAFH